MAGKYPKDGRGERFSFIADITVLPAHRGRDIANYMIQNTLAQAHGRFDAMLLCITTGNSAEALYIAVPPQKRLVRADLFPQGCVALLEPFLERNNYTKLGLIGGPHFTNMSFRGVNG